MPQKLESELFFSYNPKVVNLQLIFLLLWTVSGFVLIYITPRFFLSYIIPLLGFSLFFYLKKAYKGNYLEIKGHRLTYGSVYKTEIDLRDARRIKSLGEDFIIKTNHGNYTIKTKFLLDKKRQLLFDFFLEYSENHGVIFP